MRVGTVLLAEDDGDTRETVRDVLVAEGYRVITADRGCTLLRELEHTHGPRVALVDWAMPDMSGDEVVEAIRHSPDLRVRTCPVIIFSAARPPYVEGEDARIDKPFTLEQLVGTIEQTIR